jgi:hypothetical protein
MRTADARMHHCAPLGEVGDRVTGLTFRVVAGSVSTAGYTADRERCHRR